MPASYRVRLEPGHVPEVIEVHGRFFVVDDWAQADEDDCLSYYLLPDPEAFRPRERDVEEINRI